MDTSGEEKMNPRQLVSTLVTSHEAEIFKELAEIIREPGASLCGASMQALRGGGSIAEHVQAALREILDEESVHCLLKGSASKGTQTNRSDVDIIIETPGRSISRVEKECNPQYAKSDPNSIHYPG